MLIKSLSALIIIGLAQVNYFAHYHDHRFIKEEKDHKKIISSQSTKQLSARFGKVNLSLKKQIIRNFVILFYSVTKNKKPQLINKIAIASDFNNFELLWFGCCLSKFIDFANKKNIIFTTNYFLF